MANWSDLLSMLTLSASLNFGLAAFSYIRQSAFSPEIQALDLESIRVRNLIEDDIYKTRKPEIDSAFNNLVFIRSKYFSLEKDDLEKSYPLIIFNICCGFIAVFLIFSPIVMGYEIAGPLITWVSVGTNLGWIFFLLTVIFAIRKLHHQVRLPRMRVSEQLREIEDC